MIDACLDTVNVTADQNRYEKIVAILSSHCVGGGAGIEDDGEIEEACDPCFGCKEPDCNGCSHADEDDE